MGKPDMGYHQTEYCLSNQTVFNRGQIRPGGKNHFKTLINNKNHIWWLNMGKPDMVYHQTKYGLSNQMVFDRGQIWPGGKIHF